MKHWITAAGAAAAALLARSEYEKKHLETASYQLQASKLGTSWDGFCLVFLSDLHDNCFGKDNEELLRQIDGCRPDLVLIGGDMPVTKEWRPFGFEQLDRLLRSLTKKYPVYYALGNHEQRMKEEKLRYPGWWEAFVHTAHAAGAQLLINKTVSICRRDGTLTISGMTLDRRYYCHKGAVLPLEAGYVTRRLGNAPEGYHILLAHDPLYFCEYAAWGADLVLAGHFHGGTIRLPGLGGVMTPQLQFFNPYTKGRISRYGSEMIVSPGLGTHSINFRLNNFPQIIRVEFCCGQPE